MKFAKPCPEFSTQFWKLVSDAENIAITTHTSPDEDAIGSLLALYTVLNNKYPNKHIRLLISGHEKSRFAKLALYPKIEFLPDISTLISPTDLFIGLDGGQYHRFSNQPQELKSNTGNTICIDHHRSSPDEFTLSLISPEATSTAEIIYRLFCTETKINPDLASYLLMGILGDTGNFQYTPPAKSEILLMAQKLLLIMGTTIEQLQSQYSKVSKDSLALTTILLKNMQFHKLNGWPPFQTSYLARSILTDGYQAADISAATHFILQHFIRAVEGYTWGFVLSPKKDGTTSISLNSEPDSVNVRQLVEDLIGGGGHDRASGGTFPEADVQLCLENTLKWIGSHEPIIS